MNVLPWAHGGPPLRAVIKHQPEDFQVDEVLGFEASGEGEHVLLHVRKRETNTTWLAQQLALFSGVKPVAVGYAGLKDRQAVTTQSFTVQLPGQEQPDWTEFPHPQIQILSAERHNRKLKTGALQANRFELVLRDCVGDMNLVEQRLNQIAQLGVPNYFGEQRFGFGGSNIDRAKAMFSGRRMDRKTRSILISAARSQVFNAVLAKRVEANSWNQAMPGEVWSLNGSRSWFPASKQATEGNENIPQRLLDGDIHPSGPLWGRGTLPSEAELAELEAHCAAEHSELCAGLENVGLEQDRRALRLIVSDMLWSQPEPGLLKLAFTLPPGSYATVVLRELVE